MCMHASSAFWFWFGSISRLALINMPPKGGQKRQGVFALTDDEAANPAKLCKFAESCPAILKTGDEDKDEDVNMMRKQFLKSINSLWRNPGLCYKNVMWLEDKISAQGSKVGADMFKVVSTIGSLDETWTCSWIVSNSRIKLETLEACCFIGPESRKQILVFVLKCHLSCKMPQECKRTAVCGSCFDTRNVQCG